MKDDGRIFLRPLLTLCKAEIMAALSAASVAWREDATNSTRDYFRTRVRFEVLPRWQDAACSSVLGGAALSRELCEEDDVALEAWLTELNVVTTETTLNLQPLIGKPRALWRRALRRWLPLVTLSRAGFEELLELCVSGAGRVSVADGFIVVKDALAHFEKSAHVAIAAWTSKTLEPGEPVLLPDGAVLVARRVIFEAELKQRVLAGKVDRMVEAYVSGGDLLFHVRPWQPGDRFHPLGAPGSAKLQDLFVNRKVPVERRGALPVVCASDGAIVWVPGFSPAENVKLTEESKAGVQLTYQHGTSTVTTQS
jgi:tRNA(Ile)-lysidine synthase